MRVIEFKGDHLELGQLIGKESATIFEQYIKPGNGFQILSKWKQTDWFKETKALIKKEVPDIYRELEGIAEGAGQDFDDILLWNCRGDLIHCVAEGCTSIGMTATSSAVVAHNEDGDPELKSHVFIIEASMISSADFVSFIYPASLPGHSFSMNEHGLAFSVNNIRLTTYQTGLPRMVTSRSLQESKDHSKFIETLNTQTRCGGFHYTVADITHKKAFSVEAPYQEASVIEASPVQVHANHLVHQKLNYVEQIITDSSSSRQERMEALASQISDNDMGEQTCLNILRDNHHDVLPIFRTAADDPDEENTLATAVFTFEGTTVSCNVYSPESDVPAYSQQLTINS